MLTPSHPAAIALLFTIVMCLFIGSFHWILGVIALAAYLIVGIVIPIVISRCSGDDGLRFRTRSGELSGFVLDSLRGLSEILQYGQGKKRLSKMNEKTDELSRDEEKMKRTAGRNTAVTNTVVLTFDLIMLFASALLYQSGAVDFDGVLIPTLALFSSFGPVIALGGVGQHPAEHLCGRQSSTGYSGRNAGSRGNHRETGNHILRAQKRSRVSFSYGNETILSDVSVTIPENAVVGIVGRSGSGKSTLLKLLMRFWKVQEGSVELSGRSVEEINTKNLRDLESFVTQETQLFHDSIKNNLRIAKLTATDEEIETACKKASVHDFIMTLPKGYDTPVGELGDTLSGGERQRLGLARAFLHDAPFLLLDEPTANLDSLNEAVILKSLREERAGKTVVLVSHRQSTMRIADTVYSVEHGRMS